MGSTRAPRCAGTMQATNSDDREHDNDGPQGKKVGSAGVHR
jgi:hypothetical protein